MSKLVSLCIAVAVLFISLPAREARADLFVNVSTHFIDVPASSSATRGTIKLAATLYQPRLLPVAPAVIYIHGWGGRRLTDSNNLAHTIAAAGYTVISYTARGFGEGESGGRVGLAGPDEMSDLSAVIDWLKDDPHGVINARIGKIGVIGGSYGGGHSFQIATDPRVSAVVPMIGWTDIQQALYPNGAINYKYGLGHFYSGLEFTNGGPPFFNYDRLEFEMFDAGAEGRVPDREVLDALAARSIASTDANGRLRLKQTRRPQVPTFIIQSWDDYLFPAQQALDIYSEITADKQIYLGRTGHPPGGHNYNGEEVYIATQVLRWLNRYLLGIGGRESNTVSSAPNEFSGKLFTGNDLADVEPFSVYLKPKGVLSKKRKSKDRFETLGGIFRPEQIRSSRLGTEVPSKTDMFSGKVDPVDSLPKMLVYTFAPWQSRTELLGMGEFDLHVSSSTSATFDLVARTFDVAPDGTETEISVGVIRVKNVTPGEVRRVQFRDFGDHWVFGEGHSLRLKITNIDFPDFRPPGINDNRASQVTLHYGRVFPSSLRLPLRRD